jgi:hypothetical protein
MYNNFGSNKEKKRNTSFKGRIEKVGQRKKVSFKLKDICERKLYFSPFFSLVIK